MKIPKEFTVNNYNKTQGNYEKTLKTIEYISEFDIILNKYSTGTTLTSWELEIEHEKSYLYPIIEKINFDGILCYNNKLKKLLIFIFEEDLNSDDVIAKVEDGLYDLYYNRNIHKIYPQINFFDLNRSLTEIHIFFEKIDGIEYLKMYSKFEYSRKIKIYKIIKLDCEYNFLDKLNVKLNNITQLNPEFGLDFYINQFKEKEKIKSLFTYTLEALRIALPGETFIKVKFDLIKIDDYFKNLAEQGIDNIRRDNINLHLFYNPKEYINEYKYHYDNLNDNNIGISWETGEITETTLKDFTKLLRIIKETNPNFQIPELSYFLKMEIQINCGVNNLFKGTFKNFINEAIITLIIKESSINLNFKEKEADVNFNNTFDQIEQLINTEIVPKTYENSVNTDSQIDDSDLPF